jgi:hypothetical protein
MVCRKRRLLPSHTLSSDVGHDVVFGQSWVGAAPIRRVSPWQAVRHSASTQSTSKTPVRCLVLFCGRNVSTAPGQLTKIVDREPDALQKGGTRKRADELLQERSLERLWKREPFVSPGNAPRHLGYRGLDRSDDVVDGRPGKLAT